MKDNKTLAVIMARENSKGLPGKNIRPLAGKPLLAWTIEAALGASSLSRVIVSTDSPAIAEVALAWNAEVPFLRPARLAEDDTPGVAPVLHAMEQLPGYDIVCLLQPTSPFRDARDIDAAIALLHSSGATSVVSVVESAVHPNWMKRIDSAGFLQPYEAAELISRRQELPKVFALNGAIYAGYATTVAEIRGFHSSKTVPYVMPQERSMDIDTSFDFELCGGIL